LLQSALLHFDEFLVALLLRTLSLINFPVSLDFDVALQDDEHAIFEGRDRRAFLQLEQLQTI